MEEQSPNGYGDLSQFKELVAGIDSFSASIENIKKFLEPLLKEDVYEKLTIEEKLEYDIFVAYTFSSLFWMFQKSVGINPVTTRVKGEIDRVKEHVKRFKLVKERKSLPRIDKEAARRFIRSGLWTPGGNSDQSKRKRED